MRRTSKLPPYVQRHQNRHGKAVFYYRRPGERLVRLPDEFGSRLFKEALKAAADGYLIPYPLPATIPAAKIERTLLGALRSARTRARQKGLHFDLTKDWLLGQAAAQRFQCALTGLAFHLPHRGTARVNPFTPSIDRINCHEGYTTDNSRLVIYAVNVMLMDWGEEVFAKVARRYLRHESETKGSLT